MKFLWEVIITVLIGGVCGCMMTTIGATVNTWQFWGITACMAAMYLVGSRTRKQSGVKVVCVFEDEDDE